MSKNSFDVPVPYETQLSACSEFNNTVRSNNKPIEKYEENAAKAKRFKFEFS